MTQEARPEEQPGSDRAEPHPPGPGSRAADESGSAGQGPDLPSPAAAAVGPAPSGWVPPGDSEAPTQLVQPVDPTLLGAGVPQVEPYPQPPPAPYPPASYPPASYPPGPYPPGPYQQPYPYSQQPGGYGPTPPPYPGAVGPGTPGQPAPPRGSSAAVVAVVIGVVLLLAVVGGVAVWRPWARGTAVQSPEEWVAATNGYCRQTVDPAVKAAIATADSDRAAGLHRFAAVQRETDQRLRADPPQRYAAEVAELTARWEEAAAGWERMAVAHDTQDAAVDLEALATAADTANEQGNVIARRIGLGDCAGAGGL